MRFRYFHQPGDYLETLDLWGIYSDATYLYQVQDGRKINPPDGMRSSIPLGGLGYGTVELRADGSLRDWNIFNNRIPLHWFPKLTIRFMSEWCAADLQAD